jgi:hypothetical protein
VRLFVNDIVNWQSESHSPTTTRCVWTYEKAVDVAIQLIRRYAQRFDRGQEPNGIVPEGSCQRCPVQAILSDPDWDIVLMSLDNSKTSFNIEVLPRNLATVGNVTFSCSGDAQCAETRRDSFRHE